MKFLAKMSLALVGVTAIFSCESLASNIELQVMQGEVLVDQGKGLVSVKSAAEVAPGSRIVMRGDSAAVLNYAAEQCFVRLAPASIIHITTEAPCATGSFAASSQNTIIEPVNGTYAYIPPPPPGGGVAAFIAGGSFVGVSTLATIYSLVEVADEGQPVSTY